MLRLIKLYIKIGRKIFLKESWCKRASVKLDGGWQIGQQLMEDREALNKEGQVQVCEPGSPPELSPCRLREQALRAEPEKKTPFAMDTSI